MGADKAVHVLVGPQEYETMQPLHVSKILSKLAQDEKVDMIMLGKQAIDDDCNQTGQMVAAILDWPQKAKKKTLANKKTSAFGVEIKPTHQILSVADPPVREAGIKVESVEDLAEKLKEQGFVKS